MAARSLRLYSHSTMFYWWPVWTSSLGLGAWTLMAGVDIDLGDETIRLLPSASPAFLFGLLLLLVAIVTSQKMRGIRSVVLLLSLLLAGVLAAWAGLLDDALSAIPAFSTHLSAGFLLAFGGALFVVWVLTVFVFDRLAYWRISEGQLVRVRVIGAAEKAYDARGLTVEHEADDFLRHIVIGLGSGDIVLRTSGAESATVPLRNILLVNQKISMIQELVSIEPDD